MPILEAMRVLTMAMLSFVIAFAITPLFLKLIRHFNLSKHIRSSESAPIYAALHKNKAGRLKSMVAKLLSRSATKK